MAKLVITSGGSIAYGRNALPLEVIDVGECPGLLPAPVASTALLPTDWNGLGAPADQTIGIVNQGADAGIYVYQRNVDALIFDHWLDSVSAMRGVTYWRDTVVAAPLRISVLNGDTAALIGMVARRWSLFTAGLASITDVGAGLTAAIRLTTGNVSGQVAFLNFTPLDLSVPGPMLLICKCNYNGPAPAASNPNFGAYMNRVDGRTYRHSWSMNGQINQLAGASFGAAGSIQGAGYAHLNQFERVDFRGSWGFPFATGSGLVDSPSGAMAGTSFDRGFIPVVTEVDVNAEQIGAGGGAASVLIAVEPGSAGTVGSFDVQEIHALRVLTP